MFRFFVQLNFSKLLFVATALMMSACSHKEVRTHSQSAPPQNLSQSPREAFHQTTHYTVLEFPVGAVDLNADEKEKIKNLDRTVQRFGKPVREIQVLAWADNLEIRDNKLAAERAQLVRSLVSPQLQKRIAVFNMSEQPEKFAELIHQKDPRHKITFENTETASFGKGPKSSLVGKKDSKAIVMVRYE